MVEVAESPGPVFSLAAFCKADFDAIVERVGARPKVSKTKAFGKVIDSTKTFYLRLSDQRYAALSKYESQSEFEIALQPVKWSFYSHELALVLEFIGCDESDISRIENPPVRWVSERPSPKQQSQWLTQTGFPYPY